MCLQDLVFIFQHQGLDDVIDRKQPISYFIYTKLKEVSEAMELSLTEAHHLDLQIAK